MSEKQGRRCLRVSSASEKKRKRCRMCFGFTHRVAFSKGLYGRDVSPEWGWRGAATRGPGVLHGVKPHEPPLRTFSLARPHSSACCNTLSAPKASAGSVWPGRVGHPRRTAQADGTCGAGGEGRCGVRAGAADTSRRPVWFFTCPGRARHSAP